MAEALEATAAAIATVAKKEGVSVLERDKLYPPLTKGRCCEATEGLPNTDSL